MRNGKKLPLIVNADNRFEVEVLGTHFNVNAYADEPSLNTTLLEGKVGCYRDSLQWTESIAPTGRAGFLQMQSWQLNAS